MVGEDLNGDGDTNDPVVRYCTIPELPETKAKYANLSITYADLKFDVDAGLSVEGDINEAANFLKNALVNLSPKPWPEQVWILYETELDISGFKLGSELNQTYAGGYIDPLVLTPPTDPINATIDKTVLYKPDGTSEPLTVTAQITTGFYKISYEIPSDASDGTYTLLVEARYSTDTVDSKGTSFKSFLISPTLTLWDKMYTPMLKGIEGDIGTILTEIGYIQANLTAINATIVNINGTMATIKTNVGLIKANLGAINTTLEYIDGSMTKIKTILGAINGTITSIQGDIVTIKTDVGIIKTRLEKFMGPSGWKEGATTGVTTTAGTFNLLALTNSTLGETAFSDNTLSLTVSGSSGTKGITNVVIPKTLLGTIGSTIDLVAVTINDQVITSTYTEQSESYTLHITYTHSAEVIKIYLKGLPPTPFSWYYLAIIVAASVAAIGAVIYATRIRKKL